MRESIMVSPGYFLDGGKFVIIPDAMIGEHTFKVQIVNAHFLEKSAEGNNSGFDKVILNLNAIRESDEEKFLNHPAFVQYITAETDEERKNCEKIDLLEFSKYLISANQIVNPGQEIRVPVGGSMAEISMRAVEAPEGKEYSYEYYVNKIKVQEAQRGISLAERLKAKAAQMNQDPNTGFEANKEGANTPDPAKEEAKELANTEKGGSNGIAMF